MTWKEVKLATLQKMFSAEGLTINEADDSVSEYINAMPLDPEVAVLLPLYMASQLYKDDDITLATMYRNEFEVAFSLLQRADTGEVGGQFTCATGWW